MQILNYNTKPLKTYTMNEYNDFIKNLNKYEQIAVNVAKLINSIYPKQYPLYSDYNTIKFYDDSVSITSGEYYRGSYDEEFMSFDPKWLFLSVEEITEIVNKEKENDEIIQLQKEEEKKRKDELKKLELTNKIVDENHDKIMEIIADGGCLKMSGKIKDLIKTLVLKDEK